MERCPVRKSNFGASVLAAALIGMIACSLVVDRDPRQQAGGAIRHQPNGRPLTPAGSVAGARLVPPPEASSARAESSQSASGWPTARVVLTARLAAARRAREARRHPRPVTLRLCRRLQHVAAVDAHGAGVVVRNDNYGGRRECLANVNRRANFAVVLSAARRAGYEAGAFPNIFYGCSWGICSRGTTLPRRLSRLRHPVTSWYTAGRPPGRWDAAYDIWFARHRHTSGQDRGAEIMLWLRTGGLGRPAATHGLLIDDQRWQLEHWTTTNRASGRRWPLIIFRMIHPRGYVKRLALMPFFHTAEALGLLHRSWWLTAIEAGFEVWRGGTGLRTTLFWARP
jgi:glycosyl hydrolase family 12